MTIKCVYSQYLFPLTETILLNVTMTQPNFHEKRNSETSPASKVSFDQNLFVKEYRKAIKLLKKDETKKLRAWINENGFQPS